MRTRWREAAPGAWASLVAEDPGACPSHDPRVWAAFTATLPGYSTLIAVVESEGRVLGGAPVLLERRAGFHWLHALPMLLPGAPIAQAGRHAEVDAAVARAFAELARERSAVGGEWALYRPGVPGPANDAVDVVPGETRWFEASVVDLRDGLAAALRRMDRKARQALRPAAKRYAFAESPASLTAAYALHVRQSREWGGHRPLPVELSARLLAGGDDRVGRLFTLRDARGLASAAFALDGAHETFVWWSGTHPGGRPAQAFGRLMWSIVEWAAARGRLRVNLGASTGLGGVASFKESLGAATVRYPVRWLDARHAPPAARAMAALQRIVRARRARGASA